MAYGAIALASFPPVLVAVFGTTTVYALARLAFEPAPCGFRQRLLLGARWMVAAGLSIGLVSFYYIPAFVLSRSQPHVTALYENAGLETMPFVRAYQLLSPTIAGGIQVYAAAPLSVADGPHLPYVGIVVLIAGLLARPGISDRSRSLFVSCAVVATLILLKAFGIPPVQWLGHLPLLREIHFAHYFGISLGFALVFLAALGIDALERGFAGRRRTLAVVMLTILSVMSLRSVLSQFGVLALPHDWHWTRDWLFLNALAWIVSIVLLTGAFRRHLTWFAVSGMLLLVTVEGFFNNVYPSPRAFDIFAHPPHYVSVLKDATARSRERVLTFALLNANLNSAFGIFSMDSLMPFNPPRVYGLYKRYAGAPTSIFMREAREILPEPVLDRAGVGMVAIRDAFPQLVEEAQNRGYHETFSDGYARLFERPTLPRFFSRLSIGCFQRRKCSRRLRLRLPAMFFWRASQGFPRRLTSPSIRR